MLKFFYTISNGFNIPQSNVYHSLGGYVSSTPVSNDTFSNLFDEISLQTMANPRNEYRAIVLTNTGPDPVNNIEMWFTNLTENNWATMLVGAIQMGTDADGNPIMEATDSIYSKPYWTEFYPATETEKVGIGNLDPGQYIGLWICRELDYTKIKEDYENVAIEGTEYPIRYLPVEKQKIESINLNLSWD